MKSPISFIILLLSIILIADAARVRCADTKKVDCYIRKWRPRALRSGICSAAIACVRAKMLQEVRSSCYTDDDLGEYMGASTPSCVSRCASLGEDDSKKNRKADIPVPVHQPAREPEGFFVPHEDNTNTNGNGRFRNFWYYFRSQPSNPSNM